VVLYEIDYVRFNYRVNQHGGIVVQ
jgi:hypothetical protein